MGAGPRGASATVARGLVLGPAAGGGPAGAVRCVRGRAGACRHRACSEEWGQRKKEPKGGRLQAPASPEAPAAGADVQACTRFILSVCTVPQRPIYVHGMCTSYCLRARRLCAHGGGGGPRPARRGRLRGSSRRGAARARKPRPLAPRARRRRSGGLQAMWSDGGPASWPLRAPPILGMQMRGVPPMARAMASVAAQLRGKQQARRSRPPAAAAGLGATAGGGRRARPTTGEPLMCKCCRDRKSHAVVTLW